MGVITSSNSNQTDVNCLNSLLYVLFSVSHWKALTELLSISYGSEWNLNKDSISPL